jgi:hypothetical protein
VNGTVGDWHGGGAVRSVHGMVLYIYVPLSTGGGRVICTRAHIHTRGKETGLDLATGSVRMFTGEAGEESGAERGEAR